MGLNVITAVTFYLVFVYAVTWLVKNVGESRAEALDINTASMLLLLILLPLFAMLSDAWGRRKMLLIGTGCTVVFAYPLVYLMHQADTMSILAGQMGFAVLVACFGSSIPAAMTEMFPKKIRVTAVGVSYNFTFAIFGGTSPMVAVWLIKGSHDDLSFAWYICLSAVISFLFALFIKDRSKESLD